MIYLQLFYTFFKIGLFGFGGGYAMLSMIQGEVVTRYGWVSSQEFTDIVAISQMTPGPIGINAATYVGFTSTGSVWGSIIATFAVVLPSFILMFCWDEENLARNLVTKSSQLVMLPWGKVSSHCAALSLNENGNSRSL